MKAAAAAWEESMKEKYYNSPLGKYRIRERVQFYKERSRSNRIRRGQGPGHPLYKQEQSI